MTTVGFGDIAPRRWTGRFMALIIMVTGIGFFGYIITQLSSEVTVQKLEAGISSPRELFNRRVATVAGTTSEDALQRFGAIPVLVDEIEEAYELLENDRVDAVVFDSPTLQYFVRREGTGEFQVTGKNFDPQYYGIALPEGSDLREQLNRALLKVHQSREYDDLYQKWFGIRR